MDLYAENILDHYKHPRNTGTIPGASVSRKEENASCGDDLTIDLQIEDGVIKDLKWQGKGCALSQAGISILSEELIGKTVEEVERITPKSIHALLGVPVGPRRFKCALLCLHTLKNALRVYKKLEPQSWIETVAVEEE